MKSFVDVDGTRAVVQIIKAPILLGLEKKNTENTGLVLESPSRLSKMQSEPSFLDKGFRKIFHPENESHKNSERGESIFGFKSSWKSFDKR